MNKETSKKNILSNKKFLLVRGLKFNVVCLEGLTEDVERVSGALWEKLEGETWKVFKRGKRLTEDELLSFLKKIAGDYAVSVKVMKRVDANGWQEAAKKVLIGASDSWHVVPWATHNWYSEFKLMISGEDKPRGLIWVLPSFDYLEDPRKSQGHWLFGDLSP